MNTRFHRSATSCEVCNKRLGQGEGMVEQNCGKSYCLRCISRVFLPYFLSGQVPEIVELSCGHYKQKQEFVQVLKGVCINCGFSYRESTDLQLNNDLKLCSFCFKAERAKFQQFFWRCLSCDSIVQSWKVNNSDFVLCRQCSQSQLQIQQSIARTQPYIAKENSIISGLKSQKLFDPFAKEEEGMSNIEEPSEDLSIVSRFSALEVGSEGKRHSGKISSLRMHSKNSVEIRVQNFELGKIERKQKIQLIKCDLCNILVNLQVTLPNSSMGGGKLCKICFSQNFQLSYLSYSRYNNYFDPSSRSNSLSRQSLITLVPPSNPSYAHPSKQKYLPTTITKEIQKNQKEPWEEQNIQDPCEICHKKRYFIIRIDKKKVCADCRNKK